MEYVGFTVTASVRYPMMRAELIMALRFLSDEDYQDRVWLKQEAPTHAELYYSFEMAVHALR